VKAPGTIRLKLECVRLLSNVAFKFNLRCYSEAGIASAEEGRVLWDQGYTILDVRALSEIEYVGKLPNPKRGEVVDVVIGDKVRWCKLHR